MNPSSQKDWKDTALTQVLLGVVSDGSLKETLIFKGARILNLHLQTQRKSLDIDSSLRIDFQQSLPDRRDQADWFESKLKRTLENHFETQNPVRYTLKNIGVKNKPQREPHRHGWDGLVAEIQITDERFRNVRSLPTLKLEIAAPEDLGRNAICELSLDEVVIQAYSLHRIAGEKLRAFLTSLPTYRNKIGGERIARAKDLFDLVRILEHKPITDHLFWSNAENEFVLACESRFVDCAGLESFHENWGQTEQTYRNDPSLADVPWESAEAALGTIISFLSTQGVFPLIYPIPDVGQTPHTESPIKN